MKFDLSGSKDNLRELQVAEKSSGNVKVTGFFIPSHFIPIGGYKMTGYIAIPFRKFINVFQNDIFSYTLFLQISFNPLFL